MEILYFLIPVSLILLGIIVGVFLWSVKSGQFDDLEGPAHRILMQEEKRVPLEGEAKQGSPKDPSSTKPTH